MAVRPAARADAGEILTLQRACWIQEAVANDMWDVPALHESLDQVVTADLEAWTTFVLRSAGRLVGSVRAAGCEGDEWRSAGSWWLRTCRAAGWAGAGCSSGSRRPRRRDAGTSASSPGPAARTTCGCTAAPVSGRVASSLDPRPAGSTSRGEPPLISSARRPVAESEVVPLPGDPAVPLEGREVGGPPATGGEPREGAGGPTASINPPHPWATCGADEETP